MRNRTMICAVMVIAVGFAGVGIACDGTGPAKGSSSCCDKSVAKAAYASTLEKTGCEKTANAAFKNTLAERTYNRSYTESGCSKTATKAAYQAVLAETGCSKSATSASMHAFAQASYDETLKKTGCSKTAQAAYDTSIKSAENEADDSDAVS